MRANKPTSTRLLMEIQGKPNGTINYGMTKRTGRKLKHRSVSRSKCQPTEQNKFSSEEFDHLFVNKTTSLSASKKYNLLPEILQTRP